MRHLHARRWFRIDAHDGEGGEGGGSGEGGEGAAGGEGGSGSGGDGGGSGGDRTFTQADIDRIVQDRLARERQKVADYDDLKAKAEELDRIKAEEQTDLERAQTELEQLRQEKQQLEQSSRERDIRDAIKDAATAAKFHDPSDAAAQIDRDKLQIDDDGRVTNAEELVKGLAESKPYLVRAADGGGEGEGGEGSGSGGEGGGGNPGSADGGAKPPAGAKDFTKASREDFGSELAKYGLRPRS